MKNWIRLVSVAAVAGCVALAARAEDGQIDVTKIVADAVQNNALSIVASNDNFTDPQEGVVKKLRVEFTLGGTAGKMVVEENETLAITAPEGKKLVIVKAVYGEMEDVVTTTAIAANTADVTATVAEAVKDKKTLSIGADNDTLKGDPAEGIEKKLIVEYTVGGSAKTATVNEGETLSLPASGDGDGELVITKATYGSF